MVETKRPARCRHRFRFLCNRPLISRPIGMRNSIKLRRRSAWAVVLLCGIALSGMALPRATQSQGTKRGHAGPDSLALDSSFFQETCAPNDGPAVTLFFGGRAGKVAMGEAVAPPYVAVSIWRGWSTLAGHTFLLRPE